MKRLYNFFDRYRKFVPTRLRSTIRSIVSLKEYDTWLWVKDNPYSDSENEFILADSRIVVGILKDNLQNYKHWIAACRELGVSYRLFDLKCEDWIDQIRMANCDAFLVWPDVSSAEIKQMYDESLKIMIEEMGKTIYPSLKETWLYENKRVQHYWMHVNNLPCPKTWIFYNSQDAIAFANKISYPIVLKTNTGGASNGVFILKNFLMAKNYIKKSFKKGIRLKSGNIYDRQRGSVYFQEFLPNVTEWRMVRIGESFFGHGKERVGSFHSGSHQVNWSVPDEYVFRFLKWVTDVGSFKSMNVDVFQTEDGQLLINELQTVFGTSIAVDQMKVNGEAGRYRWLDEKWYFEAGDFCRNHMCNLRIQYLCEQLKAKKIEK